MAHEAGLNLLTRWYSRKRVVKWELAGDRVRHVPLPPGQISLGDWFDDRSESFAEIRSEFLAIEPGDREALLKFLNRHGAWDADDSDFRLSYFWEQQDRIRAILVGQRHKGWSPDQLLGAEMEEEAWVARPTPVERVPQADVLVGDTREVIYASLWIDRARKAKFRYCARLDCRAHGPGTVPFEKGRVDQEYCQQYCAHLVAVRNKRAEARAKKRRR